MNSPLTTAQEPTQIDPFVTDPSEGDDASISSADLLKLLKSINLDPTDDRVKGLLENAKDGNSIDRDAFMSVVTSLMAEDMQFGDLASSIGDFDIKL